MSVKRPNGLGAFWLRAYSSGSVAELEASVAAWPADAVPAPEVRAPPEVEWTTIVPPAIAVVAPDVSEAPSWLSYTTELPSVIFILNLSVPPPPEICPSTHDSRNE